MTNTISLAHIDTGSSIARHMKAVAKGHARAVAENIACAATFSIGQVVRTRQHGTGTIVAIEGGAISVALNDKIRKFVANMIVAA